MIVDLVKQFFAISTEGCTALLFLGLLPASSAASSLELQIFSANKIVEFFHKVSDFLYRVLTLVASVGSLGYSSHLGAWCPLLIFFPCDVGSSRWEICSGRE